MDNNKENDYKYYNHLAVKALIDSSAFEELYLYYFPRIYSFIFAKIKNATISDDIVSTVMEKVLVNLNKYDPNKGAFSTWLFRIANNCIIDYYRSSAYKKEAEWEEFFDAADNNADIENKILEKERNKNILCALDKLKEKEKYIIYLKFFSDLSNAEIARLENLTVSNVGVIIHRSLKKLKDIIADEE